MMSIICFSQNKIIISIRISFVFLSNFMFYTSLSFNIISFLEVKLSKLPSLLFQFFLYIHFPGEKSSSGFGLWFIPILDSFFLNLLILWTWFVSKSDWILVNFSIFFENFRSIELHIFVYFWEKYLISFWIYSAYVIGFNNADPTSILFQTFIPLL